MSLPINETLLNPSLFGLESVQRLNHSFTNSLPFKYLIVDDFLNDDIAKKIEMTFPPIDLMKVKYKGLNENKAEDSSFEKFSPVIKELNQCLHSTDFIEWVSKVTGLEDLSTIDDRLGAGLHQGGNKSFLDIHIDYNIHAGEKKLRRLNLLIFFNLDWKEEWGGILELWSKTKCFKKIIPSFNRMVLFECNEISYHGYSTINCQEAVTRKSYYHYFFQDMIQSTKYHDTIFLLKPNDNFVKKILTFSKEFGKNTTKRILYKLGFNKFLK